MGSTTVPAAAPLWQDDNGRLACGPHGGSYLAAAIAKRPRARSHSTPRGRWYAITAADVAAWPADELGPMTCETCGAPAVTA